MTAMYALYHAGAFMPSIYYAYNTTLLQKDCMPTMYALYYETSVQPDCRKLFNFLLQQLTIRIVGEVCRRYNNELNSKSV